MPNHKHCPTCGEALVEGSPRERHETVTRVVRAGQRYGDAVAGQHVLVERRHEADPSVVAATESLVESRARRSAEAAKKEAPSAPGLLRTMVDGAIEAQRAAVAADIARGRARAAELEAQHAAPPAG